MASPIPTLEEPTITVTTRAPESKSEGSKTGILNIPVEVQTLVFEYVLQEEDAIEVDIIFRQGGSREIVRYGKARERKNSAWRTQVFDEEAGEWRDERPPVPRNTALLSVSKEISAVAFEVLYGANAFEFTSTTVLAGFLEVIGTHARYLRFIEVTGDSDLRSGYVKSSAPRAAALLRKARGLRKLKLNDNAIEWGDTKVCQIAQDFQAVVTSLQASYASQGLKSDPLDVIRLEANPFSRQDQSTRVAASNEMLRQEFQLFLAGDVDFEVEEGEGGNAEG